MGLLLLGLRRDPLAESSLSLHCASDAYGDGLDSKVQNPLLVALGLGMMKSAKRNAIL
jgi:hypothetical protein